jgi:hypothetical protein
MTMGDLRNDPAARRTRILALALPAEFASSDGILTTREGPVAYAQGDALLTGIAGERWPVPRQRFAEAYEPVAPLRAGKPGRYRKRPQIVWAKLMREPFAVELGGVRGTLHGGAGDWLLEYAPGDRSVVSAAAFAQTYELLD